MQKKLKLLISSALVATTFFVTQIHSSETPADQAITLIQPNGTQMRVKINLDRHLSDLRSELKEGISSDDIFQQEGVGISQNNEKNWTIREIIKDNSVSLRSKESLISRIFDNVKPPEKRDISKFTQSPTFTLNPLPQDIPTLLSSENAISETTNMTEYYDLLEENRKTLFKSLGLEQTLNINIIKAEDPSLAKVDIERPSEQIIQWIKEPRAQKPDDGDLKVERFCSYSKIHHELRKSGIANIEANAHYLGIGSNTEYKSTAERLDRNEETEVYLLATYDVPKIVLTIPTSSIKATPEFEKKIANAVNRDDDEKSIKAYKKLIKIFDKHGFLIPTRFHLGGQLWCEEKKQVKTKDELKLGERSFGLSTEASFSSASISAGGGTANNTSNTTSQTEMQQGIRKNIKGGDIRFENDTGKWMDSLGPWQKWSVIKMDAFHPVIDVLNSELKKKCKTLIKAHYKAEKSTWTLEGMKEAKHPKPFKLDPKLVIKPQDLMTTRNRNQKNSNDFL